MIDYTIRDAVGVDELIDVFDSSGIRRPTHDHERIQKMIERASLFVTARIDNRLIGVARSLTDGVWATYLSDLAVRADYQRQGVGTLLIQKTREAIGPEAMLLLLAAPEAEGYYPKLGFSEVQPAQGWMIPRASWTQ